MDKYQWCYHIIRFFLINAFTLNNPFYSHGFHKDTIVRCGNGSTIMSLSNIAKKIESSARLYVASYDVQKNTWTSKRVYTAGFSSIPFYCTISFNESPNSDIVCSPTQHFYRVPDNQWITAHQLSHGDQLLCEKNNVVVVSAVDIVYEPLTVYTIEVKNTHTFLVGDYGVLAHNIIIPLAATIGFSIPFSTGCGSGIGAVFGPIGLVGGILLGSALGLVIDTCLKDKFVEYNVALSSLDTNSFAREAVKHNQSMNGENQESDKKSSEAQAPGKPTENDGFVPNKNWNGEKVKHRRGYGWPDKKGSVWIPSGPNGHGGPHWDVQYSDGSYDNIVPGGRIRGKK